MFRLWVSDSRKLFHIFMQQQNDSSEIGLSVYQVQDPVDAMLRCLVQVKEVFAVTGGAQGLVRLLDSSTSLDLLVEIGWVLCHATHSQTDANRLVHLGLVPPAMQQIRACTLQVSLCLLVQQSEPSFSMHVPSCS